MVACMSAQICRAPRPRRGRGNQNPNWAGSTQYSHIEHSTGKVNGDCVTPLIVFAEQFAVAPFYINFSPNAVVGRLRDAAVDQAALKSRFVDEARGSLKIHGVSPASSSTGSRVCLLQPSTRLKDADIFGNVIVYIGRESVLEEQTHRGLLTLLGQHPKAGQKQSCQCCCM
uniref:Uncharacterized protein n=1 Tax=Trypanosoma congolense (strain IL3000) TaxID=1068625 RepID=G0UY61_TRYCI|nr:conserved hypothetical protein [Trypanosoma congolense IL3000]